MSVGLFRLISTVKSVFLFQYWKLFIIPLFVFLAGCDDKAQTQEVRLHVPYERLSSIIRLAES